MLLGKNYFTHNAFNKFQLKHLNLKSIINFFYKKGLQSSSSKIDNKKKDMITTFRRVGFRQGALNKRPIWNLVPYILVRRIRQPNTHRVALDEQHQMTQYKKKLKGQQGALSKTTSSPESRHERSLIRNMESDKEIIQYLKENSSQDITIYSAAVKKCSELKCPNSIIQIIDIVQSKYIHPDIIFYTTILYHLGMWDKFDLQKHYFQQWFEEQQDQSDHQLL
ncbi:hypothetical protein RFI_03147, partial [Reticulomyxa filosa]